MKQWRLLLKKDSLSIAVLFTAATFIIFSSLSSFAQTPNTYDWTDDNLNADAVQSGTRIPIKQTHIQELRTHINAKRVQCLMGNYPWTDSTLQTGQTKVRKVHIDELRQAVQQIYDHQPASRPRIPASFTDPTITEYVTRVRATHIDELRTAIENATCCGDNAINGPEQCDRNQLGGATCVSLGYSGGTLACIPPDDTNHGCEFDISGCYLCGDGTCEPLKGENCPNCPLPECCCPDGDCFDPGENCDTCEADCGVCPYCGDGNADTSIGEECDGSDLEGKTCITQGFSNGTLNCNSECKFDTSGCSCAAPIINTVNCLNDSSAGPVEIFYTENACSNIKEFRLVRAGQPGIVIWRPNLSYCDWAGSYCMYLGGANPGDQTIWIEAYDDYYPAGNLVATSNSVNFNCCGDETCATKYETADNCPVDCVICQNEIIEGDEECDGDDFDGKTCEDILGAGYTGTLSCDENCSIDTSGCTAPPTERCGNNIYEGTNGEDCDGTDLGHCGCITLCGLGGVPGGFATCNPDCTCNCSMCMCGNLICDNGETKTTCPGDCGCGNGVINTGESCDGSNLNEEDCASVLGAGYTGTLSCNSNCTFDTSGCTAPLCPNGNIDAGEQCDGANLNGKTCVTEGFDSGNLTCNTDCTFNTSGCSSSYICTGSDPANATLCPGSDTGLTANTPKTSMMTCTGAKCEYYCNSGYCPAGTPPVCVAIPTCNNVPSNSTKCSNGGGLTCGNTYNATLVSSCTAGNICEYTCNSGYYLSGGVCVPYICTGADPSNASFCVGSDVGLTANTPKTAFATCTGTKCQYACKSGYCAAGSPVVCYANPTCGTAPSNATRCNANEGLTCGTTYTSTVVSTCNASNRCEYTCNSGYVLSGGVCVSSCGNGTCDTGENTTTCPSDCCNYGSWSAGICGGGACVHYKLQQVRTAPGCSDETRCVPNECGDGVICEADQCEGSNLNGQTCLSQGFNGGTLSCNTTTCFFDTSGCYTCGNGTCESAKGETPANCQSDCCPYASYSWTRGDCEVMCGGTQCGYTYACYTGTLTGCPTRYECRYDDSFCYLNDYKEGTSFEISKK